MRKTAAAAEGSLNESPWIICRWNMQKGERLVGSTRDSKSRRSLASTGQTRLHLVLARSRHPDRRGASMPVSINDCWRLPHTLVSCALCTYRKAACRLVGTRVAIWITATSVWKSYMSMWCQRTILTWSQDHCIHMHAHSLLLEPPRVEYSFGSVHASSSERYNLSNNLYPSMVYVHVR